MPRFIAPGCGAANGRIGLGGPPEVIPTATRLERSRGPRPVPSVMRYHNFGVCSYVAIRACLARPTAIRGSTGAGVGVCLQTEVDSSEFGPSYPCMTLFVFSWWREEGGAPAALEPL